jgi:hypothetical protein
VADVPSPPRSGGEEHVLFLFIFFSIVVVVKRSIGRSERATTVWTHIESLILYHLLVGFRWTCPES